MRPAGTWERTSSSSIPERRITPLSGRRAILRRSTLLARPRSQGGFINAKGEAVGTYRDEDQKRHGFIWRKGVFTSFNVPGDGPDPSGTVAFGINDIGEVVGTYVGPSLDPQMIQGMHGFVRSRNGEFTTIDVPDALFTVAEGINNAGTIVGVYGDNDGFHGFVRSRNGDFTTIDLGAKTNTQINSINAKGEIVGFYVDSNNKQHGFLGTPAR
jgi:uncharacterized membrane protein